jgi:hypothetical protein
MDKDDDNERQFICPITAYPCEGDLSYLCKEYGCARKGGLSPHSEENLMARWPVQPQLIERPADVREYVALGCAPVNPRLTRRK